VHRPQAASKGLRGGGKWIGAVALIAFVAAVSFQAGHRSTESASAPVRSGPVPAHSGDGLGALRAAAGATTPQASAAVSLPARSVAEVLALPTDFSRTHAAYALATQADELALLALIDDAKRVERRSDRLALIAILMGRYGEIDPVRALSHIADSDLENKPSLVYRVVHSWSKVDLDAAIEALSRLDGEQGMAAADAILAAHADADPAVLADVRARLAEPAVAASVSPQMVLRTATIDPAAALAEASRLGGQDRLAIILSIGGMWARTAPEQAFAHSRTIADPAIREAMQRGVFMAWMVDDPGTVLRLLATDLSDTERSAILNVGLVRFAHGDPRRAFREVGSVEDPGLRSAALQAVLRTWAQQDPFAASAALDEVAAEDIASLGPAVGREFALRAPAEALDWASRFERRSAGTYGVVLTEVARIDPQIALQSAFSFSEVGDQAGHFALILSTVAERNPIAAAGYWQQVPAEARAQATLAVVARWQMQDPDAAASWLLGLPAGADRDAGLGRLVAMATDDAIDIPRLLNAMSSAEIREQSALNRIRNLAGTGRLTQAESELGRIDLSPDAYRAARAVIDANR
jgi:hypothetical protein